jgi:hypothetical protein
VEQEGVPVEVVVAAISAVIALAALAVSIVVARRQTAIASEQTAIQKRLAAIEEARRAEEVEARGRARVTASLARDEQPGFVVRSGQLAPKPIPLRLVLHNDGPALARSVYIAVEEGADRPQVLGLEALPIDLQPGQSMTFIVTVGLRSMPRMRVTVRWTDEAGDHEEPFTLQAV